MPRTCICRRTCRPISAFTASWSQRPSARPPEPRQLAALAAELTHAFDTGPLERTGSFDGALSAIDGTRFRFNIFKRQNAFAIALRRLEDRFRSLADLGLPSSLYQLCDLPDGLVVVCGPPGPGKSTTLASLLHQINQNAVATSSPSRIRSSTCMRRCAAW